MSETLMYLAFFAMMFGSIFCIISCIMGCYLHEYDKTWGIMLALFLICCSSAAGFQELALG